MKSKWLNLLFCVLFSVAATAEESCGNSEETDKKLKELLERTYCSRNMSFDNCKEAMLIMAAGGAGTGVAAKKYRDIKDKLSKLKPDVCGWAKNEIRPNPYEIITQLFIVPSFAARTCSISDIRHTMTTVQGSLVAEKRGYEKKVTEIDDEIKKKSEAIAKAHNDVTPEKMKVSINSDRQFVESIDKFVAQHGDNPAMKAKVDEAKLKREKTMLRINKYEAALEPLKSLENAKMELNHKISIVGENLGRTRTSYPNNKALAAALDDIAGNVKNPHMLDKLAELRLKVAQADPDIPLKRTSPLLNSRVIKTVGGKAVGRLVLGAAGGAFNVGMALANVPNLGCAERYSPWETVDEDCKNACELDDNFKSFINMDESDQKKALQEWPNMCKALDCVHKKEMAKARTLKGSCGENNSFILRDERARINFVVKMDPTGKKMQSIQQNGYYASIGGSTITFDGDERISSMAYKDGGRRREITKDQFSDPDKYSEQAEMMIGNFEKYMPDMAKLSNCCAKGDTVCDGLIDNSSGAGGYSTQGAGGSSNTGGGGANQ